jgi:hypothetical protein
VNVTPSDDPRANFGLVSVSGGDVVATREWARTLLTPLPALPDLAAQARLVLTAASLLLQARIGPDPTLCDLRCLLSGLASGALDCTLLAVSPIQFVQYVAAELADARDGAFDAAFDLAVRAVSAATP